MKDPIVSTLHALDSPPQVPVPHVTTNGQNGAGEPQRRSLRVVEIVDRDQWNAIVTGRPTYDLPQGWEWGEVQRDAGFTPHRYAVLAGSACVAAMSVTCRRLPGLPYWVLYASRGPLLDWHDERAWRGLRLMIRDLSDRYRPVFLRVSPAVAHDDTVAAAALARQGFRPVPDDWTTWNAARVVLTLNLDGDEPAQQARLRKGIRRDLAAARRRGAQVRAARDGADLLAFHRLTVAAGREKGYPVRPLARLEALWRTYVERGDGVLLLTEHEGELIGGVLGLRFGHRAYLHRATIMRDIDGQRLHQGPLVYWELIRWARTVGCDLIDWGGSGTRYPPSESDDGYGVYQFKRGFGAELRCWLPYHDLVFRPGLYRLVRAAESRVLPRAWRLRARLNR
jgi:hypothetical protein